MARYSIKPKDRIFVKGYGFLSSNKNMSKNIGKYISKNLSSKYSEKRLEHAEKSAINPLNITSK